MFVDSSHVYKAGSDVQYLMREVYPKLKVGSFLHIHDVYLPFPWPKRNYLKKNWFWNEQDHLVEFLSFNHEFKLVLPVYWLFRESSEVRSVVEGLAGENWVSGTSLYFQRVVDVRT